MAASNYKGYDIAKRGRRYIVTLSGVQIADAPNLDTAKGDVERHIKKLAK